MGAGKTGELLDCDAGGEEGWKENWVRRIRDCKTDLKNFGQSAWVFEPKSSLQRSPTSLQKWACVHSTGLSSWLGVAWEVCFGTNMVIGPEGQQVDCRSVSRLSVLGWWVILAAWTGEEEGPGGRWDYESLVWAELNLRCWWEYAFEEAEAVVENASLELKRETRKWSYRFSDSSEWINESEQDFLVMEYWEESRLGDMGKQHGKGWIAEQPEMK